MGRALMLGSKDNNNYCFGREVSRGILIESNFIGTLLFLGGNWVVLFADIGVPLALV
jgi:hypothetical protein